ncbi:hypothetical protein AB4343_03215 [Vibrio breoganii]|uniref:Uncharacterized protein n=1 Tax=Vibrio breoganii TaxID=553239 RepID=A0AAP8MTN4_9VIBR|nr:hypothetical protein [Vibrio breoganii]ANO33118.1 hypothetical protein A6E01_07800 [Vibrio breoganii]NMO73767.1 hypothetical protein [Vibrio breoganii]NMR70205.1 hypothetical protein [Vibrio breoganii]OCH71870.1 hypothetical protein A6D95_04945 [Vibrio breoganii]OED93603.1 hypothetical protein A1QG_02290 [Vibrio breoganii ZF-29]
MKIFYETKRGKHKGLIQQPHRHKNGKFAVSKARFDEGYTYVESTEDIYKYLRQGYKVKVSSAEPLTAPSLVGLASLTIE